MRRKKNWIVFSFRNCVIPFIVFALFCWRHSWYYSVENEHTMGTKAHLWNGNNDGIGGNNEQIKWRTEVKIKESVRKNMLFNDSLMDCCTGLVQTLILKLTSIELVVHLALFSVFFRLFFLAIGQLTQLRLAVSKVHENYATSNLPKLFCFCVWSQNLATWIVLRKIIIAIDISRNANATKENTLWRMFTAFYIYILYTL